MVVNHDNKLLCCLRGCECRHEITYFEKVEKLFTTEDGVDIIKDEVVDLAVVGEDWEWAWMSSHHYEEPSEREGFKFFKTKEAAEAYIEANKPKPLFRTEDGVDIYLDDPYVWVNEDWELIKTVAQQHHTSAKAHTGCKYAADFSTKKAAEDYILLNKPCLSIKDILNISDTHGNYNLSDLEAIVKLKLK